METSVQKKPKTHKSSKLYEISDHKRLIVQGQALHLDRGLFEIFRTLLLAKISKNDTNIIFRSLKKIYVFQNWRTVAQKSRELRSF